MTPKQREIQRKSRVIEYAEEIGNVRKACRYYGVARSTFYLWRTRYRKCGDEGLMNRRRVAHNHPNKTPAEVVGKILHLEVSPENIACANDPNTDGFSTWISLLVHERLLA